MTKSELNKAIAEKSGLTVKDAEKAIDAFTDVIAETLCKGDKVQLLGFGTFDVTKRDEHEARNPHTGETFMAAASKSPKFKASKVLKDAVNGV